MLSVERVERRHGIEGVEAVLLSHGCRHCRHRHCVVSLDDDDGDDDDDDDGSDGDDEGDDDEYWVKKKKRTTTTTTMTLQRLTTDALMKLFGNRSPNLAATTPPQPSLDTTSLSQLAGLWCSNFLSSTVSR